MDANTKSQPFVDADFIEIGTSNFNTITQLIDDADGLVGFAVEPSLHYLNSLPHKTGVTKANRAIVSAADATLGGQTVDFYYIPEEIIVEKQLHSFIKGCNSVGTYHPCPKTTLHCIQNEFLFESNVDSQKQIVEDLIHKFVQLGYKMKLVGSDTIMELQDVA